MVSERLSKPATNQHTVGMRYSLACLALAIVVLHARPAAGQTAKSRWKEIGKTSVGNTVYVDPKTVKKVNGITTARLRVKFATPTDAPEGKWYESHHTAMFDCAKKAIAAKESIYYGDAAATKVVRRSVIAQPGYGPAIGGSMTQVALDYFCKA
jgi:hypothetical protein